MIGVPDGARDRPSGLIPGRPGEKIGFDGWLDAVLPERWKWWKKRKRGTMAIIAVQVEVLIDPANYTEYIPGVTDPQEIAREVIGDWLVSDAWDEEGNGAAVVGSRFLDDSELAAWKAAAKDNPFPHTR